LPYRINFENDSSATAPAQNVTIRNKVSEDLNWSTFELNDIAFGDYYISIPQGTQHFETTKEISYNDVSFVVRIEAGIHLTTGNVYVNFYSIDPITELPPEVDIGFLPPEDGTGRGQGYISYFILPNNDLSTGHEIRNIAEIVFDNQPPITTNQIDPHDPSKGTDPLKEALVTVDAEAPTSSINELPSISTSTHLLISWSGSDYSGSGIDEFDIYVSINDLPFQIWLKGTSATSEIYEAENDQSLSFYSISRDYVGNEENLPTSAQAKTLVNVKNDSDNNNNDDGGGGCFINAMIY